jgi:hypothetical protein
MDFATDTTLRTPRPVGVYNDTHSAIRTPTIACKPSAIMAHPLNTISGSIKAYNFENEDFLYEAPDYRHLLVADNKHSDAVVM